MVGIGGAYMCIYGMEGPGGYPLFGRTIQVWNSWRLTQAFRAKKDIWDKPWLLRFFDRIRFFPVSHEELTEWRRDFPLGRRDIRIEEGVFCLSDYLAFLADNAESITAFQARRQAAFDAERTDWQARGEFDRLAQLESEDGAAGAATEIEVSEGCELVEASFGGVVWKLEIGEGQIVQSGQTVAVIEAMKMESPVPSPFGGKVRRIYVSPRQQVFPGAPLFALEPTGERQA